MIQAHLFDRPGIHKSYINNFGNIVDTKYQHEATDPQGYVMYFENKPTIEKIPCGLGEQTDDWGCDGICTWTGRLASPVDWELSLRTIVETK